MERKVRTVREIKLDRTDPGKKLKEGEVCTVEEVLEE